MPFPPTIRLPSLSSSTAASACIAVLIGSAAGAALASNPVILVALIGMLLGLMGVAVALDHPGPTFVGLVLFMALIPTYAAPAIGPLLFDPAAAAAWLVAGALAWRNAIHQGRVFRPTAIDYAAGAFALLMAISVSFSARAALTDYVHLMFLWAGPYLAARLLLRETTRPARVVAVAFVLVTVILAPIAVLELLGVSNPFHALDFNSAEFSIWANQIERFGQVRAVTSFGHPIAFSMFIAVSAILSIAMGINSKERRNVWYALAALAVGIQALALARTGWLIIAIGVVMLGLLATKGKTRQRLVAPLAVVASVVLLVYVVAPGEVQILPGLEHSTEKSYASSGDYRQALLTRALEPGVLNLWGNPVNQVTPFVNGGSATDNAYIILADSWGLIPTFALIATALMLLISAARARRDDDEVETWAVLPIAAFACMVALFFVAFITQQQLMIWMLVGAASAGAERARGPAPASLPRLLA